MLSRFAFIVPLPPFSWQPTIGIYRGRSFRQFVDQCRGQIGTVFGFVVALIVFAFFPVVCSP